jgi:hypothetical protein
VVDNWQLPGGVMSIGHPPASLTAFWIWGRLSTVQEIFAEGIIIDFHSLTIFGGGVS